MSKAQIVVDTYYEMRANNDVSYEPCYDQALSAAEYHGGIEIYNTNDRLPSCILSTPNQTFKFPNRIFKFDDGSYVIVTYTGADILTKEGVAHILTKEDLDESWVFSYTKGSISASFFVFQFL